MFVVLALLVTPQLRDWYLQQRRLHDLRQGITTSQQQVDALRTERARWEDPEYVKAQARKRLHFVMPGETGFAVTGAQPQPDSPGSPGSPGDAGAEPPAGRPWFADLWASVQRAGDPGTDGRLTDQQLIDRQRPGDEVLVDHGSP